MARILVVDDNVDMLNMLRMILERNTPHGVITAHNGQDGLEKAFSQQPEIALVDVMMPGISGYEVVKQLRADSRTKSMGLIVLTARGQPVDREAALAAGADDHMPKPVDVDQLVSRIESLLGGGTQESAPAPIAAILPLMSLRGGVGVTTLAVNLAGILQQITPTVLLDLSPNGGHCTLLLGMRADKHWGQYVAQPDTPIESLVQKHPSGLHVLAAPPLPMSEGMSHEAVTALLARLQQIGRFVVIDMPPTLNAATPAILGQAHRILLITSDDPPAIQTTRATVKALEEHRGKLMVVRNAPASGARVPAEALQRALHAPLVADVAHDPAVGVALRKGKALAVLQSKTAMVAGLGRLVKSILGR